MHSVLYIMSRETNHKYLYPVMRVQGFLYWDLVIYCLLYFLFFYLDFFLPTYVVKHLSLSYRHFSFATIICFLGKSDLLFSHALPSWFISNTCLCYDGIVARNKRPTQTNNYVENYMWKKNNDRWWWWETMHDVFCVLIFLSYQSYTVI